MELPSLSPHAVLLYRYLLMHPRARAVEAVEALELSSLTVDALLTDLQVLGLARSAPDDPELLLAINPEVAAAQTLFPVDRDIKLRQEQLFSARAQLEELLPIYAEHQARWRGRSAVEVLRTLDAVQSVLRQLAGSCEEEVLTSQPGGGRAVAVLEDAISRDEEMLRRGVRMRTLYQHTARYDPPTGSYVERVTRLGAQVRTLSDGFARLIMFDRRVALISLRDEPMGALLIHDTSLLDFMLAVFERAWSAASSFPVNYTQREVKALSSEIQQDIVHLLVAGYDDRAISRRMGMALRTCQRHISSIMESLGARSRLQAGFLIAQRGILEEPPRVPSGPASGTGH